MRYRREDRCGALLAKEMREIAGGRALWIMLLLLCGLVGFSFLQAAELYGEASSSAQEFSRAGRLAVAAGRHSRSDARRVLSRGDAAISVRGDPGLSNEKETGALRLLMQLPYSVSALCAAKLAAVLLAWAAAGVPAFSALAIWMIAGGHIHGGETLNLLFGHLLYGMLIGSIALFAAAISESSATAAIIVLAVTIGSWVLDFTAAGHSGMLGWLSQISLTQTLRPFEQGLLSAGLVIGMSGAILGFTALAGIWLPPGISTATEAVALRHLWSWRMRHPRRGRRRSSHGRRDRGSPKFLPGGRSDSSFRNSPGVWRSRSTSLRKTRDFWICKETSFQSSNVPCQASPSTWPSRARGDDADRYGEVDYSYAGRADMSRSTSPREILPLIYGLAGVPPPSALSAPDYPGYPLVMDARWAAPWFFGLLPLAIIICWWHSRRPPKIITSLKESNHDKPTHALEYRTVHVGDFLWRDPAFAQQQVKVDFSNETVGAEPKSFLSVVGIWRVEQEGAKKVLAVDGRQWKEGQSSAGVADKARALYGDRYAEFLDRVQAYAYFPYAVAKDVEDFRNGEISVRFEGISGRIDQGAGILFNLKPNGDYLTVRANPLENNLVLWKFEKGKRSSVKWIRNTPTPTRQWHDLKVRISGTKVEAYLDGKLYLEHSLPEPVSGRIGLWSKADSYVYFADYSATPANVDLARNGLRVT